MDLGHILDRAPEPVQPLSILAYKTQDTSGNYSLRVPMTQMQKELTDQVVSSHYSDILKLFHSVHEPSLAQSLETLSRNLQLVSTHPFLLIDHYIPRSLLLKDVPLKLATFSGKFSVLGQILDVISDFKLKIALISRPGKCMDLLEAFILGKHVNYYRCSGTSLREQGPPDETLSTIYLIPSDATSTFNIHSTGFFAGGKLDFILAFDCTFNESDDHLRWMQTYNRTRPAPILRLIPSDTIEHILLCNSKSQEGTAGVDADADPNTQTLRYVLAAAVILRGKVGAISSDFQALYAHELRPLADWFRDPLAPWPLPPLPQIPRYSAEDVEKSLLTEITHTNIYSSSNRFGIGKTSGANTTNGESGSNGSARSMLALESISTGSSRSGPGGVPSSDYYAFKKQKRDTDYTWPSTNLEDSTMPAKGNILTHQLLYRLGELLDLASKQNEELESHRSLASERELLVESLREELGEKISQIDNMEARVRMAERKAERCQMDTARAREQQEQLSLELSETRLVLEDDHPEKALIDNQRREIEELKSQVQKANEKAEARSTENDYMRGEYQKASGAASEAQSRVQELEKDNKQVQHKLELDIVNLRQLSFDEERRLKDQIISEQNARLLLLEEQIQRMMNTEKVAIGRRSAARAPSVPRNEKSQTPK